MNKKPDYTAWYLQNPATGEEYYYLQQPTYVVRLNLRDLRITYPDVEHLVYGLRDARSLQPVTIDQYRQAIRLFWLLLIKHDLISFSNLLKIMLKKEEYFRDKKDLLKLRTTWYLLGFLPVYCSEIYVKN